MTTVAPAAAIDLATPDPIPEEAPVMIATWPANFLSIHYLKVGFKPSG
jgi:hypothetical protein